MLSDNYAIAVVHSGEGVPVRYRRRIEVVRAQSVVLHEPGELGVMQQDTGLVVAQDLHIAPSLLVDAAVERGVRANAVHFDRLVVEGHSGVSNVSRLQASLARRQWTLAAEEVWVEVLDNLIETHIRHRPLPPPLRRERRSIRRVREMLEDRLAENITLTELADVAGLNKFYLLRCFKAHFGLPPAAYQRIARVSRARVLLRKGIEAADVASECGFADQSHMVRTFKKVAGMTPGQYARGGTRS